MPSKPKSSAEVREDDTIPAGTSLSPHLVLDYGKGEEQIGRFPCRPQFNQMLLWKHRVGFLTGEFDSVMVMLEALVLDEARPALEEFLIAHGDDPDFTQVIYDAMFAAVRGETNLPKAQSSDSSDSTSSTEPKSTAD
jgi:hypothetical protein